MKRKNLGLLSVLFCLAITLSLCACSSSSNLYKLAYDGNIETEAITEPSVQLYSNAQNGLLYEKADFEIEAENINLDTQSSSYAQSSRKIIYSSWYEIKTEQYDLSVSTLNSLCEKYGAYFENSESYGTKSESSNRNSSYVVRIPIENYKSFINETSSIGSVTSSGERNEDVTENYFDTQARLESAKLREERLLEILKNAAKLDDVLALERELSDVRYEIESFQGTLNKLDSLVSYATARISIREVKKIIPVDSEKLPLGTRMSSAIERGFVNMRDEFDGLLIDLSYSLPVLLIVWIPFIIIVAVIVLIIKAKIKKARAKKNAAVVDASVVESDKK